MKNEPEEIMIPFTVLQEMPDAFEKACEICGIDSMATKLTVLF